MFLSAKNKMFFSVPFSERKKTEKKFKELVQVLKPFVGLEICCDIFSARVFLYEGHKLAVKARCYCPVLWPYGILRGVIITGARIFLRNGLWLKY